MINKEPVYLNGEKLAYQYNMHLSAADASGPDVVGVFGKHVRWIYREPIIQTESWSTSSHPFFTNVETFVDPTGSKVETIDPATLPPPPPPIEPPILELYYFGAVNNDWESACIVDGRPMDCDRATRLLSSGAARLVGHGAYQHNIVPTRRGTYFIHVLPDTGEGHHVDDYIVGFIPFAFQQQQGGGQNRGVQPSCHDFVDLLVDLLRDSTAVERITPGIQGRTQAHDRIGRSTVKRALDNVDVNGDKYLKGPSLPEGFRQDLIDNGQGGDVYRHIEFVAGNYFLGTTGQAAISTFIEYDRAQAKQGRQESVTELRDDEAGRQVGKAMLDTFNSHSTFNKRANEERLDDLRNTLRGILCAQ